MVIFIKILILGGDKKQLYVADYLKTTGYDIYLCGFDTYGVLKHKCVSIDKISDFETIILPLPVSKDKLTVYMPFSKQSLTLVALEEKCKNCTVLGGNISLNIANYIDYYKSESLNILNAIPTAEGALLCALENSEITIYGSKCLVIGNGRIGKILSDRLSALKAKVYVSARKESDLAYIKASGNTAIQTEDIYAHIHKFDFIFNTVPHLVLNDKIISMCNKNSLIIDLASIPGGTDFTAAQKRNIKTIHALALPSKTSPKTAAEFIANTIIQYLNTRIQGEKL